MSTKTQFPQFNEPIHDYKEYGEKLYKKSIAVIRSAQAQSGGIQASLPHTRYAGFIYPRDHAYSLRALLKAEELESAANAIDFILTCELSTNGIMFQRYDLAGKNASYKPVQIDGNAQSVISLLAYITKQKINKQSLHDKIHELLGGITKQIHHFPRGSLVYSLNGIIEFSPFETGYEIYTNAVCYKAYFEAANYFSTRDATKASQYKKLAIQVQNGITAYLYYPAEKTFITCLRGEPDASVVTLPNLKSILALTDFAVFPLDDPRITSTLTYHLKGTKNIELGGFNRYHASIGRHNFGNGVWILVMCRLAYYYQQTQQFSKAKNIFNWVMQAAKHNLDYSDGLPEHVSTIESFTHEYDSFKQTMDTAPRPAKLQEYETIEKSQILKHFGLAYAVNPLVWSHAAFILAWKQLPLRTFAHNL